MDIIGRAKMDMDAHFDSSNRVEGKFAKILPYGAQVKLGDSSISGLLHISKITLRRFGSVSDVLQVDESLKVLVVKSLFPDKISLSIADLESEPGLFISGIEGMRYLKKRI
ncbi:unnamed protein product [Microthlaspi erraticum]|uniref:S1 motif domain-containing protein n=1 Tax=Microthlaspi erraticum TaxID=1685480 RepID=A0A6D2INT9_9BRAS|nr:unnamed protein product [Microthlaspi erraticum]